MAGQRLVARGMAGKRLAARGMAGQRLVARGKAGQRLTAWDMVEAGKALVARQSQQAGQHSSWCYFSSDMGQKRI